MAADLIFDTSAVLALAERRNPQMLAIARRAGKPSLRSMTVLGELWHGAKGGATKRERAERMATVEFYGRITSMPAAVPDELAERYGDLSALATEAGLRVGMNDRWIVAESIVHAAQLVTCDVTQMRLNEKVGFLDTIFVEQN